ncbi:MAG TPA: M1 family aminopeptidase, partial [Bacteroidota bacterium]|nr:M1 family aminopeptidase [Bacteroidota bacterium]
GFDEVRFDAADMKITDARLDGKRLEYHHTGETLAVTLDKMYGLSDTLNFTVAYDLSSPQKGLYFIIPDSGYPKQQRLVWSNGETEENHFWFPCYDFPNEMSTSEMIVTVNENWTAISNGKLIDVKRDPDSHTATYHWYEGKPHVVYLTSLVAGEYVEVKDSAGTVPLSYFVYKHQKDDAMRSFSKTPKVMEFYASKIGYPYPWEKYSQTVVQDYIWGGEENVSATTLTDNTIHDARAHIDVSSDDLVAHELAHQWWGDMLTTRDWAHTWLNEGFATYFTVLFQEHDRGTDVALKSMYDAQRDIVNTDFGDRRKPSVNKWFVNSNEIFTNRIYGKGACVLHMLRFIVGDELFWKAINHYARKHAFQNVETNDFKVAVEEATGYNLHWFFDEWLYKPGYPEFEVKSSWDKPSGTVKVSVRQTQKVDSLTGIFRTPVDIEVWVRDEPSTHRVMIAKQEEEFTFPASWRPQLVLFDKGSKILKKLKHEKPIDEWIFQLLHAKDGVDRIAAADELRWTPDSNVVTKALRKAASDDPYLEVRREAVWALVDAKRTDVSEVMLDAYRDPEARVRAAAVAGMKNPNNDRIVQTLRRAFESDSSYAVATAALAALVKVDSMNAKKYCREALLRDSHREGLRTAALRALGDIGDDDAFAIVSEYAGYGRPRNVRLEALGILSRVWKTREGLVQFFIAFLSDPSVPVRRYAIGVLAEMGNAQALGPLQTAAETETEPKIAKAAREALAKIQQAQQH